MITLKSDQKGFTLIELLVVVVILGIVAGIVATTNLKGGADTAALNAQTSQLISDLRLLQTQASASKESASFTINADGNGYRTEANGKSEDISLEREVKIIAVDSSPKKVTFNEEGATGSSSDYVYELSVNGEKKKVKISPQGLVQAD